MNLQAVSHFMRILPFHLRKLASYLTVYRNFMATCQNKCGLTCKRNILLCITFVLYNVRLYIFHLLSNLNKTIINDKKYYYNYINHLIVEKIQLLKLF